MDYNKLNKLIDHAINYETDDYLLNINIKSEIADKLLKYQFRHVFNLMCSLRNNNVVLDGSDTGTGKTYTAIAVCKQLKLKPFIICPKSIIPNWKKICKFFKVKPLGVVNYETIKSGKYYNKDGDRINCPFITINQQLKNKNMFKWNLPKNSIIIFDEVHNCKNSKSINGKLLMSTKELNKVLLISATISDKPESFQIFGYMLNFYKTVRRGNGWIKSMLREDKCSIGSSQKLSSINRKIYPNKGSRMRIVELGKTFPDNQISALCYKLDKDIEKEVNLCFEKIKLGQMNIRWITKDNKTKKDVLKDITKARMKIEICKVPIFQELIEDYLENGFSVVVFVNYRKTMDLIAKKFKKYCLVHGSQTEQERYNSVNDFQNNKKNLIICTMGAGSQGLNLHDLYGVPRVSLISPTFKAVELMQALGRIYRSGAKSPALQRIIFCSNTCEEIICNRVKEKLKFTSKLNDNDLLEIRNK
jgi:SNF2 family DNA or RNA helicase